MQGFEERMERLEEIASKLRDGTVRVDQATELFEEGLRLSRTLQEELRSLEQRIEILTNDPDGGSDAPPELSPFSSGEAP